MSERSLRSWAPACHAANAVDIFLQEPYKVFQNADSQQECMPQMLTTDRLLSRARQMLMSLRCSTRSVVARYQPLKAAASTRYCRRASAALVTAALRLLSEAHCCQARNGFCR